MEKNKTKRTFESKPVGSSRVRLASSRVPALDRVTPEMYSQLSSKQQVELVSRLIEFLKTI